MCDNTVAGSLAHQFVPFTHHRRASIYGTMYELPHSARSLYNHPIEFVHVPIPTVSLAHHYMYFPCTCSFQRRKPLVRTVWVSGVRAGALYSSLHPVPSAPLFLP